MTARAPTVAQVMTTRVHVASPTTPVELLVRVLEENRISAIPVVDHLGAPIGLVSRAGLRLGELHGLVARDVMSSLPISIPADSELTDASRLMRARGIGFLVVVDERGKIAGIVTPGDLRQAGGP